MCQPLRCLIFLVSSRAKGSPADGTRRCALGLAVMAAGGSASGAAFRRPTLPGAARKPKALLLLSTASTKAYTGHSVSDPSDSKESGFERKRMLSKEHFAVVLYESWILKRPSCCWLY